MDKHVTEERLKMVFSVQSMIRLYSEHELGKSVTIWESTVGAVS
jgi:hypothetical protein